jgi:hypothetical protein
VADAQSPSKLGLTRGKTILIGILSVALLAVLYVQFGGGEQPAAPAVGYRPPRPDVAVQPTSVAQKPVMLASATTPGQTSVSKEKTKVANAPSLIDQKRWQSPKLEKLASYDPFALPPAFPQPAKLAAGGKRGESADLMAAAAADEAAKLAEAVEKQRMDLEELRQRGVHVVTTDGDQTVAVIGERVLHVGDTINGFTVTAIDPDSNEPVHLEKKDAP